MPRRRTVGRAIAALVALLVQALPLSARAGTLRAVDPFWFRDGYHGLSSIDTAQTTATVDTAGTGTVILPYAPFQLALGPAAGRALVATEAGVEAAVWDGRAVRPLAAWGLGALRAEGATWLPGGGAFAVSTPGAVAVYGLDAAGAVERVAVGNVPGIGALAPGPQADPSSLLGQTSTGAVLLAPGAGGRLRPLSGGPSGLYDNLGVAATQDGAVVATWQRDAIQIWAWNGTAYHIAAGWQPSPPARGQGAVVGVAFFPQGGGFWVLTGTGQLRAYAYGSWGLAELPGWSASLPVAPDPPAGVAAGWGTASVAVLYPWGWTYLDPGPSGTFAPDAARSLQGQTYAAFRASAVLQSTPLAAAVPVGTLRLEDADCTPQIPGTRCTGGASLPPGTALAFGLSAVGCGAWTPAQAFSNVAVAAGTEVCYRVALSTTDPSRTPRLDVTNLFEIRAQATSGVVPALLCVHATC